MNRTNAIYGLLAAILLLTVSTPADHHEYPDLPVPPHDDLEAGKIVEMVWAHPDARPDQVRHYTRYDLWHRYWYNREVKDANGNSYDPKRWVDRHQLMAEALVNAGAAWEHERCHGSGCDPDTFKMGTQVGGWWVAWKSDTDIILKKANGEPPPDQPPTLTPPNTP